MNATAIKLGGVDPKHGPTCPYCGAGSILTDSAVVYGTSYGNIWLCKNYPRCDAYVGVHKEGEWKDFPLGRLANAELREAKKKAHSVFDQLWKCGHMKRGEAYRWMQEKMKKKVIDCHIGEFTVTECYDLYERVSSYLNNRN